MVNYCCNNTDSWGMQFSTELRGQPISYIRSFAYILAKVVPEGKLYVARNHMSVASHYFMQKM